MRGTKLLPKYVSLFWISILQFRPHIYNGYGERHCMETLLLPYLQGTSTRHLRTATIILHAQWTGLLHQLDCWNNISIS